MHPLVVPLLVLVVPPGLFWLWWSQVGVRSARWRREQLDAWLYLWPALCVITTFYLVPVVYAFALSLHQASARDPFHEYVGFANYDRIFRFGTFWQRWSETGDASAAVSFAWDKVDWNFWVALSNTAWYAVMTVALSIFLGLAVALLLNQKLRGVGIYRTIYFLPVVTSVAAVSLVWKLLYHPQRGVLNEVGGAVGMPQLAWLEEGRGVFRMMGEGLGMDWPTWMPVGPSLALVSVALMSVWKGFGYNVVIFLAGLQNIPEELYEAATIDGATTWDRFWHVTWPLLSPTTFFILIMSTIGSFQVFAQIFMLYAGQATSSSRVIVYYLYEKAFQNFDLGYAAAIAYVLFFIIFLLTMIQRRFVGSKVHYANQG